MKTGTATTTARPAGLTIRGLVNRWLGLLRPMAYDMWRSRHLAREIFARDIAREYRQSLLGVLLAFLPALVIAAWATMIEHARIITLPKDMALPYAPFVLISLMLWQTFVESIQAPIMGLRAELGTIARSSVPSEAIILAKFGEILFGFGVKLILIAFAMLWYQIPFTPWILFAPVTLLLLVLFGMGIGLVLAPLNIFYRDVGAAITPVTTFWLFLTPVIVPVPREGWAAWIVRINPVTPLLSATRELLTTGAITMPIGLAIMVFVTMIVFVFGCVFFRSTLPLLLDQANV
ncbi:ABC transporter permease [bacterium]|nr:ABC transporter permease [bacterium]